MAPVALFLPIWAFMIWGTLEAPTYDEEGPIAAVVLFMLNVLRVTVQEVAVELVIN